VNSFVLLSLALKADGTQGTLFGRERTCVFVSQPFAVVLSLVFVSTSIIKAIRSLLAWHRSTIPCSSSLARLEHSSYRVCLSAMETPPIIRSACSHTPFTCNTWTSPHTAVLPFQHMDHGDCLSVNASLQLSHIHHAIHTHGKHTKHKRRTRTTTVSGHSGRIPSRILEVRSEHYRGFAGAFPGKVGFLFKFMSCAF
jgi:hypothetical protein